MTPAPSSTLPGSTATFTWIPQNASVLQWWLHVGSTQGAIDIRDTGSLGTSRSATVTNLPTTGTVWVRLWYQLASSWQSRDFQYSTGGTIPTTVPLTIEKTGTGQGTITSAPSGISCGGTCTTNFDTGTDLTLSAVAASGSSFDGWSGGGCSGTGTCAIELSQATTVTATFLTLQTTGDPSVVTPIPESTISGGSTTFVWGSNGTPVTEWWLYVGTSQGTKNIFNSGSLASNRLSQTVSSLPTNGGPLWVRLWWRTASTSWQSIDVSYTGNN